MSTQRSSAQVLAFLSELGIDAPTKQHPAVFTVEESQQLRGEIPGAHTKNLFLRDQKKNYFLITLAEDTAVDLKGLRSLIGARGSLSFASPEALLEVLGIRPGAVSLLAVINDEEKKVSVVIEDKLLSAQYVNCHPLENDQTTSLTPEQVLVFLEKTDHEPLRLSLS